MSETILNIELVNQTDKHRPPPLHSYPLLQNRGARATSSQTQCCPGSRWETCLRIEFKALKFWSISTGLVQRCESTQAHTLTEMEHPGLVHAGFGLRLFSDRETVPSILMVDYQSIKNLASASRFGTDCRWACTKVGA